MNGIRNIKKFVDRKKFKEFYNSVSNSLLFKRLFRNTCYLFSAEVFSSILGFFKTILLARFLGVDKYGVLVLIMAYVMTINKILDFKVWETVVKYVSDFWVNEKKALAWATVKLAYLIDFSTGVVAFLVALFASPFAANLLHRQEIKSLAGIFAFKLLFSTINETSKAILRVFDKFKWISVQYIFQSIVSLGLIALVLISGYGLKMLLWAYVLSSFLGTVLFSYFSIKVISNNLWDYRREGRISLLKDRFFEMGKFLIHTNLSGFWSMIIQDFPVLILGYFKSATEVGYFRLAKQFVLMGGKIQQPLYDSIFPEIARMWASQNIKKLKSFLKKLTSISALIFVPTGLSVVILCPLIINLTVGFEFAPAILSIRIMIWGIIIASVFLWTRPTIIAIGKPQWANIIGGINAVTLFVLSFTFVPKYGYIASSVLSLVPAMIWVSVIIMVVRSGLRAVGGK